MASLPFICLLTLLVGGGWWQVNAVPPKLTAPDGVKFDNFGSTLDIFEDILVVSSIQDDDLAVDAGE
jgi:hypothetical protein